MAEDATLLEGRKTKLELSKDATLCGTPKQQRNFIWVAFYALAITCGLVLRRASILEREATLDAAMDPSAWEIKYVARVRLKAEGFDKIVVVAEQTFESNAVGCNKFDNGPMTDSFRGLVAVDRAGYAVWYFNRTISAPGAHVEAFSQFTSMRDTAHFCVNDQNTVSVFVADAAGSVGATLLPEHVSNRTKNGTALESWTFMGHECRATRGGQIVTTGFALADVGSQKLEVEDESIHYLAEEFFLLWDPFVEDEPVTELVWVSDYVSLEDAVKALDGEGDNEKVIMEIVDVDDAVAATGSYLMYFHVSSLVWQFSSVLERNDFSFASPSDRFWDPHDAVLDTVNGTQRLCLMDEGYFRDACEEQSESVDYYCYSRGVCYVLDAASGSASKAYDYSFPNNGVLSSLHLEAMDVFNKNGGDVVPVPDTRHMLTAFTSVYKTQFASNSYAFETDADGGETKAIIKLPHIEDWTSASGGTSGLYRVLPITSVNGEGAHAPEAWLSHTS
ncbi:hypothetical protein JL721_3363 [Aureococcus anophagefferens]|nr:hypothetical protein JL721_3363 [Aureococcus anophagefferens]